MKLPSLMIYLILFCNQLGAAQSGDSVSANPDIRLLPLINASHEQSYITFGSGVGNIKPLLFEASIVPSYFLISRKASWAVAISPKVIIRMMNEQSQPIRTPSYMPQISFYHTLKPPPILKKWCKQGIWHLKLVHHSNGQDGNFFDPYSGRVNYVNGDFYTNYAEWGVSYSGCRRRVGNNTIYSVRTWAEYHPDIFRSDALDNKYGFFRTYVSYSVNKPSTWKHILSHTKIEAKIGYLFGSMQQVETSVLERRMIISATCILYPRRVEQLAFFVQLYQGQDYYNIYFVHNLTLLRFGIISETLNFKQLQQLFGPAD